MQTTVFSFLPVAILLALFYGLIFFCIWKFYQVLSRINENLVGIRQALEQSGRPGPMVSG